MSGQMTPSNNSGNSNLSQYHEATSFHRELVKAEKAFEKGKKKPVGNFSSKWHTQVNDRTEKDPDGRVTCVSEQTTQMSSSYSYKKNDGGCTVQ
ncbi:hypothetical protein PoB_000602200 [Plakobranchus ocellatus]|uniref:Uncharacterized protein n=1 Tax=Plakobranchus ocellatus TaxID=259542 RepID=A0AAV3Y9N9_9GAST|nr:hypothetical protein PoB_000602200 [Plakobranchus ocellatus]